MHKRPGRSMKGGDRYHRPQGRHRTYRRERPPARREMVTRGRAGDVGLDGRLRVDLEPVGMDMAEQLTRGRGAEVFTPRGDSLGNVDVIVGTLERPIAVVRLHRDARKAAGDVRGRELFLG